MSVIDRIQSDGIGRTPHERSCGCAARTGPHPLLPGRSTIELESSDVRATIVPSSGGRIASLVNRSSGREWMWAPPGGQSRDRSRRTESDFAASPMVGADECIPTVGACMVDGMTYADHGDAWQRTWSMLATELPSSCAMAVDLETPGLRMQRHAMVDASTLRLDYMVQRTDRSLQPWLWSWHPLFAMPVLPRLELEGLKSGPRMQDSLGVDTGHMRRLLLDNSQQSPLRSLDLGGHGRSAKLFFDTHSEGAATLHDDASGACVRIRWKGEALQGLGLWINRGGWNGYHHVAIEPCTAPVESPADLSDPRSCPSEATWTILTELGG